MKQIDLSLVFKNEPDPLDFVICGLAVGTVGNIVSPGGTGKSFLGIEMAMGVASADADASLLKVANSKEGKVAIFNAEDPEKVIKQRLYAVGQYLNSDAQNQVLENTHIHSLVGEQPSLLDPKFLSQIIKKCEGVRLVIFDTFTRFHHLNENDNGQMSLVVSCYEKIAVETGAAVLFLHHVNKGLQFNGQPFTQQSRGASAISDNCRWQAFLQGMSKEEEKANGLEEGYRRRFVRFGVSKENYGVATSDRWFERVQNGVLIPSSLKQSKNIINSKPKLKVVQKKAGGLNDKFV